MPQFLVIHGKEKHNVDLPGDTTVGALRKHLEQCTLVPAAMQKLMFKGMMKDDAATLDAAGIIDASKVKMMGSKASDVLAVAAPPPSVTAAAAGASGSSGAAGAQLDLGEAKHKKIIDRGPPADAMPGIIGMDEALPENITGVLDSTGSKVRVKCDASTNELVLATASATRRLPYAAVRKVFIDAIPSHPGYSIVTLQLGDVGAGNDMYLYFFPTQYTKTFRNALTWMSQFL